ncbi:Crp/Fnr family transcriptional regulator, partial [Mesorhizobium sp. M7A.F.Ca.ET.027.03.2.1]
MVALDRSLISRLPLFQGLAPEEQSEILT